MREYPSVALDDYSDIIKVCDVIVSTMGPRGGAVVLDRMGEKVEFTQDGVNVARNIALGAEGEMRVAANLVKQACEQTLNRVGDGTTTTAFLIREFVEAIQEGSMPTGAAAADTLEALVDSLIQFFRDHPDKFDEVFRRVEEGDRETLFQLAMISAHGREDIATAVADLWTKVTPIGQITVASTEGAGISTHYLPGYIVPGGMYIPDVFRNNQSGNFFANNAVVCISANGIDTAGDMVKILNHYNAYRATKEGEDAGGLVIIAPGYDKPAMNVLYSNLEQNASRPSDVKGVMACAVRMPLFKGEVINWCEDLTAVVGQPKVFSQFLDQRFIDLDKKGFERLRFGRALSVTVNNHQTVIVPNGKYTATGELKARSAVHEDRIYHLKTALDKAEGEEAMLLQERLSRLIGGIGQINVGRNDDGEKTRILDLVDDAVKACRAAYRSGISVGMGRFLYDLAFYVTEFAGDDQIGETLMRVMRQQTFDLIKSFGGYSVDIMESLVDGGEAGDIVDWTLVNSPDVSDVFVNGFDHGVIDPVDAPLEALEVASRVAANLMRARYIVKIK